MNNETKPRSIKKLSMLAIAASFTVLGAMTAFAAPPEEMAQEVVASIGGVGLEVETAEAEVERPKGPGFEPKTVQEVNLSVEKQRREIERKGPSFATELKQFDEAMEVTAGDASPEEEVALSDDEELKVTSDDEEASLVNETPEEASTGEEKLEEILPEVATPADAKRGPGIFEEEEETQQEEPTYEAHNLISLGEFRTTAYCSCPRCNGKWVTTATGEDFQENHTVAVDPRVIPLGSTISIDGALYVAEDTGGAIKGARIDVFHGTHQEARNYGVQVKEVFLVA